MRITGTVSVWPNKDKREELELETFIQSYRCLPHGGELVIERKSECPDYIVRNRATGEEFGVELTSVYLNDRSVPDEHKKDIDEPVPIPWDTEQIAKYKIRLVEAIRDKIQKARNQYLQGLPLVLSIYVNEYISIYMDDEKEWGNLTLENRDVFSDLSPFREVVFCKLPNNSVCSVRAGLDFVFQKYAVEKGR